MHLGEALSVSFKFQNANSRYQTLHDFEFSQIATLQPDYMLFHTKPAHQLLSKSGSARPPRLKNI